MADKEKKAKEEQEEKVEKAELEECNCDDDDDEIFELVDDEGNVVCFYPVASFEYKDVEYMVFEPAEPNEEYAEDEAVIFQVNHEDDEIIYSAIDSEERLNEVFKEFLRLQDECDESDECECGLCHGRHGEECGKEECKKDDKKGDCGCGCGCKH